jgi:CrcB protein
MTIKVVFIPSSMRANNYATTPPETSRVLTARAVTPDFNPFRGWTFSARPVKQNPGGMVSPSITAMTLSYFWVALGGALGSVTRFWLNGVVSQRYGETFPWGTMAVNVSGSLVIGILAALVLPEGRMSSEARTFTIQFLMIGVCGGFTTFSSFSLQTINLIREREWLYAGGNILLSVILCLAATWIGYLLGAALTASRGN